MADFRSPFVPELPRFTGGAVGYLGYGAASWFEPVLGDLGSAADGADDAGFMLFDTVLAFDHVQHRILLIANARISADDDLESLYQFACAKIQFLERELERNLSHCERPERTAGVELRSNHTRERFEEQVRKAKYHIAAGDIYQVVLSQRFEAEVTVDPFTVYRALRHVNPSPYMYFIRMGGVSVVGLVARDAGAGRRLARRDASDCRHAAPRTQRGGGPAAGRGAEAEREGARRARHARRPRPQRRRPRLRIRVGARAAVHGARALLARDAPDVDRRREARRRSRSAGRAGVVLSGGHRVGRAEGARDADHPRARAVGPRALRRRGRLSRFRRQPGFLHRDPHGHHVGRARRTCRPAPASSWIRIRRPSTRKRATRRARSCARSSWRSRACDHDRRHRQLRFVHLQPRAVPGRARRRGARHAQRCGDGRRRAGGETGPAS